MPLPTPARALTSLFVLTALMTTWACSSSEEGDEQGAAGAAGAAAGAAGAAGSGKAGASGASGASGQSGQAGTSGKGGAGGVAGAAGAGAGGTAGAGAKAGAAGTAGAAGVGGAAGNGGVGGKGGTGGTAGSAGASGSAGGKACSVDADCKAFLPTTVPANCAVALCEKGSKTCRFVAKDGDGDGHGISKCKASDGTPIEVGDDCDDNDKLTFPGAWDGPKGDGYPDRCDLIDEDCSGSPDDGKLADGTTCTCTPGDVDTKCDKDSGGQPISFPTGTPLGACSYGKRTCLANGTWGPCIGAVGPKEEKCNKVDDDCNGVVDDGPAPENVPVDAVYWAYDGDNDLHGMIPGTGGYQPVRSCSYVPPAKAPAACAQGAFDGCSLGASAAECCPDTGWKLASAIPADDCNDENPKINPAQPQECLGLDNHCDGVVNKGCVCAPGEVDSQCSEVNGSPVTWPLGAPVGSCKYGTRQCESTGKAWSACGGGIAPKSKDDCSIEGNDDDCNGIPNEGCSCFPAGKTQPCGSATGSCKQGVQTCGATGTWSECVGGITPKPQDACDAGNDDNCNGIANEGCGCVNGAPCGSASTCNAGTWSGCIANVSSGTCSGGFPQAPVGNACNVNGSLLGACKNGGKVTCPASGNGAEGCAPNEAGIGTSAFQSHIAPSSPGSLDWSCDGSVEVRYPKSSGYFKAWDSAVAACNLPGRAATYCQGFTPYGQWGCPFNDTNFFTCIDSNNPYYDPAYDFLCLDQGFLFGCSWNGSACVATTINASYTMECR